MVSISPRSSKKRGIIGSCLRSPKTLVLFIIAIFCFHNYAKQQKLGITTEGNLTKIKSASANPPHKPVQSTDVLDQAKQAGGLRKEPPSTEQQEDAEQSNVKITKKQQEEWLYEPKNVKHFWKKMGDRPFQRDFYSRLKKFNRVLDVGARGYNRFCKDLINSTSVEYYQMEPNLPSEPSEMNNDGLLQCYMQEVMTKYPEQAGSFDLIIDFGVFGWGSVQEGFDEDGVKKYVDSVLWLLKDKACWALKVDKGWVPDQDKFFEKFLLPHFTLRDFDNNAFKSGHKVKGNNFKFYFLYKN